MHYFGDFEQKKILIGSQEIDDSLGSGRITPTSKVEDQKYKDSAIYIQENNLGTSDDTNSIHYRANRLFLSQHENFISPRGTSPDLNLK